MANVKALAALIGLLTLATMMGACLDAGASLTAQRPEWFSGYVFSYTDYGRISVKSSGAGPDGEKSRDESDNFGPNKIVFEVLNTTMKGGDEPAYLIAYTQTSKEEMERTSQGPADASAELVGGSRVVLSALRKRDLNDMPAIPQMDVDDCVNRVCNFNLRSVQIGPGPEWTFLEFPLKGGKKWSSTTTSQADDFEGLSVKVKASTDGRARASTPLGAIPAIRVNFDFVPEGLDEYKDKIRKEAEDDGVRIRDLELALKHRAIVYYAPSYNAIVRFDRSIEQTFRVSGEEDGESFSFGYQRRVDFHRELTGARFFTYPERDLHAIGRVLLGETPLADPMGQAFKPVGYVVGIEGETKVLNAAAGESADYKATLRGVAELPKGHSLAWRAVDAGGKQAADGSGPTFQFKPTGPGLYVIEVESRDENGNVTSGASQQLAANFVGSFRPTCPQASANVLTTPCQAWSLPVRPGIRSMTAVARVSGPLAPLMQGELRITDAAGVVSRDSSRSGDEYRIEFGADRVFNIKGIGTQDWPMVYAPTRSALETVEYRVEMMYAEPTLTSGTTSTSLDRFIAALQDQDLAPPGGAGLV